MNPIDAPNEIFFDKLFNQLLVLNKLNQAQTKTVLLRLFRNCSVQEVSLVDKLIKSCVDYNKTGNYVKSFVNIHEPFYGELNKRFRYLNVAEP